MSMVVPEITLADIPAWITEQIGYATEMQAQGLRENDPALYDQGRRDLAALHTLQRYYPNSRVLRSVSRTELWHLVDKIRHVTNIELARRVLAVWVEGLGISIFTEAREVQRAGEDLPQFLSEDARALEALLARPNLTAEPSVAEVARRWNQHSRMMSEIGFDIGALPPATEIPWARQPSSGVEGPHIPGMENQQAGLAAASSAMSHANASLSSLGEAFTKMSSVVRKLLDSLPTEAIGGSDGALVRHVRQELGTIEETILDLVQPDPDL